MVRILLAIVAALVSADFAYAQSYASQALNINLPPIVSYAATSVSFSPGLRYVYGFDITQGATAGYMAILNLAAPPASGAAITPTACEYVAAGGSLRFRTEIPDRMTLGAVAISTSSCTTFTPVVPVQMGLLGQ